MPRTVVLQGEALSTQHIYGSRGHRRYMKSDAAALKEAYGWQAKADWNAPPLTVGLAVRIEFYFATNRKRDLDNHNKIVLDALNGIVWEDDKQIDDLHLVRNPADPVNPRVEVTIIPL